MKKKKRATAGVYYMNVSECRLLLFGPVAPWRRTPTLRRRGLSNPGSRASTGLAATGACVGTTDALEIVGVVTVVAAAAAAAAVWAAESSVCMM